LLTLFERDLGEHPPALLPLLNQSFVTSFKVKVHSMSPWFEELYANLVQLSDPPPPSMHALYEDGYDSGDGYEDSHDNGYQEGYEDGYKDSYEDGYQDGYQDGYEDSDKGGYEDGYEDGYKDGYRCHELICS
jgi:hypothetical protein